MSILTIWTNRDSYPYRRSPRICANPEGLWSWSEKLNMTTMQVNRNMFWRDVLQQLQQFPHQASLCLLCYQLTGPFFPGNPPSHIPTHPHTPTHTHAHFPVKHRPSNIWVPGKLLNLLCRCSLELMQNTSGQTDVLSPGWVPCFIYRSYPIGNKPALSPCYARTQGSRELWIEDKIQWIAVCFFPNSHLTRNFQSISLYDTHVRGTGQLLPLHATDEDIIGILLPTLMSKLIQSLFKERLLRTNPLHISNTQQK